MVFTVGSLLCGLAPTVAVPLDRPRRRRASAARSCSPPRWRCSPARSSGKERGTAFAFFGATTGVAVAVGPVLGGVLTSGLSWRWIFWVNIPICVLALAVTLTKVEETPRPARRAGRTGSASSPSARASGCWCSRLIRGGVDGWGDALRRRQLRRRGVLLVAFVVSQLLQEQPMFDLGLLRKPTFVGGLVAAFGVSASVFSLLTYLVIYVQNVLGYSAVEAGVRFLFLSGHVVRGRDHRRPAHQPRADQVADRAGLPASPRSGCS